MTSLDPKPTIIYVTNARIPTERAQGIQIINTCAALSAAGADVELVVPWRYNALKADPFEYYGVPKNFKIKKVPTLDVIFLGSFGFLLQEWSFTISAWLYLAFLKKTETKKIIYVRGERVFSGLISLAKKYPLYLESHMKPKDMDAKLSLFKKAQGVIVITKYYQKELEERGIRTACIPDGVTTSNFDITLSQEEARKKLGLPLDKKIVMCTAHFYSWKGVDTLAEAAKKLPNDVLTVLVGGSPEDLEPFKKRHTDPHIVYTGMRPYKEIPSYLKAADIVVLPNTKKEDVSVWYTSPIKLFEYMASNRPIISSDLPSMREVLNESNAAFATPDDPDSFVTTILMLLDNKERAAALAAQARKDVENYSWDKRAERILNFI